MIPELWLPENIGALAEQHARMLVAGHIAPAPKMTIIRQMPHLCMLLYHLSSKLIRERYSFAIRINRQNGRRTWPYTKVGPCINNCRLLQRAIADPDYSGTTELQELYDLQFQYLCTLLVNPEIGLTELCDCTTFNRINRVLLNLRRIDHITEGTALDDAYWRTASLAPVLPLPPSNEPLQEPIASLAERNSQPATVSDNMSDEIVSSATLRESTPERPPDKSPVPDRIASVPRHPAYRSSPNDTRARHVAWCEHLGIRIAKTAMYYDDTGMARLKTVAYRSKLGDSISDQYSDEESMPIW